MRERLSSQTLEALDLAEDEARAMGHEYLGTEHLLLGLMGRAQGPAAAALRAQGIEPDYVRAEAERIVGRGEASVPGPIPLTPLATRAITQAVSEAEAEGRELAGGEDLLLALSSVRDGLAARILLRRDISPEQIRAELANQPGSESKPAG